MSDISQLQEEIAVLRKMLLDVWPPRGVPQQVATTGGGSFPVALALAGGTATTDFTYNVTSLDGLTSYGTGMLAKWGRIIPGAYCIAATRGIGFIDANNQFTLEIAYETYGKVACT